MTPQTASENVGETLEIGDVVRYEKPYTTAEGNCYAFGIVAELLGTEGIDHDVFKNRREAGTVSTYPYNPKTESIELTSQGLPSHVDFPREELTQVHDASSTGYGIQDEMLAGDIQNYIRDLPHDWAHRMDEMEPALKAMAQNGVIENYTMTQYWLSDPILKIIVEEGETSLAEDLAEQYDLEVEETVHHDGRDMVYLRTKGDEAI